MNFLSFVIQNHLKILINLVLALLHIMVKRGHEVDLEYSKKQIIDKMNSFFGYAVVEKLKFSQF